MSEQEYDSVETDETTPEVETSLEDQYGEPNDGPEVEDDPRLDAEVTDEDSDEAMGLDDHEAVGTSRELSEAEGDEDPVFEDSEGSVDSDDSEDSDDPDESAESEADDNDPLERSAASCGPSRVTGSSCTPTPAWRTG